MALNYSLLRKPKKCVRSMSEISRKGWDEKGRYGIDNLWASCVYTGFFLVGNGFLCEPTRLTKYPPPHSELSLSFHHELFDSCSFEN